MSLAKRFLRDDRVQSVVARLIASYLRFTYRSMSWEIIGQHHLDQLRSQGLPVLAAFWHGRMAMMRFLWREEGRFSVLMSSHRDGRLIARALALLDVGAIIGSSRRGGGSALLRIIKTLRDGGCVGVTPDGPKGPRMRAKPGIAAAALGAGVPILPVTYSAQRAVIFRSWDRLMIPLPFTRGIFVIGEPLSAEGSDEAVRTLVEVRLNVITAEADRAVGRIAILPDPETVDAGT